ncbi:MAG: amidohydrolase [Deltaproteobacteria bacterium]|nr:amidohydrolase [Deltaproteobacteria bacterium]
MKVFRAKAIVTSNEAHDVFEDGFLAIEKNKIVDVGPWKNRPRAKTAQIVDATYGIIAPGLFNLHTHLPMTLLRGVAEDVDFQTWIFKIILPLEKKWVSPEFVRIGTELALCESLRNGVTFVSDMYYFESDIAACVDKFGLRGWLLEHIWDQESFDFPSGEAALEKSVSFVKKYKDHPRIRTGIAPHAPYTCSQEILRQSGEFAREHNAPMMIHLSETKKEFDDMQAQYQMTPTEYLEKSGVLKSPQILLAHSVWMKDSDFKILAKPNLSVVMNSQCNAKLASGVAPVQQYLERGVRFVMGTDGAASNNNMDIIAEMNFLSKVHHLTEKNLKGLPGPIVFDAATRRAAEAVGLSKQLGSLEPGKEADFIILNAEQPHLSPLTNVYAHLIYSARGSDVESVYIAGKPLMKKYKILVADEAKIRARANALWAKMKKSIEMPKNSTSS